MRYPYYQVWPLQKALHALGQHEQGMVASDIVGSSKLHAISPDALNFASRPVMYYFQVGETFCAPAQPVRLYFIDRIPSRSLQQPPDIIPTTPTIKLYGSTHMENWMRFQLQPAIVWTIHHSSAHSEFRVLSEAFETGLEVIWLQTNVAIQLYNEIPIFRLQGSEAIIECLNDTCPGYAASSVSPMNSPNPWVLVRTIL